MRFKLALVDGRADGFRVGMLWWKWNYEKSIAEIQ